MSGQADGSVHRFWKWRLGRLRLEIQFYRHTYSTSPDRIVIQPSIIWDRKR
jgi:hypothetical protein